MKEEQFNELAMLMKNEDLKEYAGEAFVNFIEAVISKNRVSGAVATKNVKDILLHMSTVIFWGKMKKRQKN